MDRKLMNVHSHQPAPKPNTRVRAVFWIRGGGSVETTADLHVGPNATDRDIAEHLRPQVDYNPERPLDIDSVDITRRPL